MAQAVSALTTDENRRKTSRLRELGVYELPDGRRYVVSTLYADGCSLYPLHAWASFGNAEFWVDGDGRILRLGNPTRWTVRDLLDTGRTSTYPKPIIR